MQRGEEVELQQTQSSVDRFFRDRVSHDHDVFGLDQDAFAGVSQSPVQINTDGNLSAIGQLANDDRS